MKQLDFTLLLATGIPFIMACFWPAPDLAKEEGMKIALLVAIWMTGLIKEDNKK